MPRILLIDDDASLLDALSMAFEDAGHEVLTAPDGSRGMDRVLAERPDAVVSDVNMPGLDGFSLCRKLRANGDATPFVLLTSRDNEIDETLGFELGADDYVAKPFSTRVLLARVSALLRRDAMKASAVFERPVSAGLLELFPGRLEVRYAKTVIAVTVTEFRMLEALATRAGNVAFARPTAPELVRGDDSVVVERIIDTYVRRLRRKLEAVDPTFDRIETVIGAGYRGGSSSALETPPRRNATSLRTNAFHGALAMLVLPQAIVAGWSLMERDIGKKLQAETSAAPSTRPPLDRPA